HTRRSSDLTKAKRRVSASKQQPPPPEPPANQIAPQCRSSVRRLGSAPSCQASPSLRPSPQTPHPTLSPPTPPCCHFAPRPQFCSLQLYLEWQLGPKPNFAADAPLNGSLPTGLLRGSQRV